MSWPGTAALTVPCRCVGSMRTRPFVASNVAGVASVAGSVERAERDDVLADRQRVRVENGARRAGLQHLRVRADVDDHRAMQPRDAIAAHRERALHRELIAAARDDVAVDGIDTLAADAVAGVHDLGREPPLLRRQRAERDRHRAGGLGGERREAGGAGRGHAVDLERGRRRRVHRDAAVGAVGAEPRAERRRCTSWLRRRSRRGRRAAAAPSRRRARSRRRCTGVP